MDFLICLGMEPKPGIGNSSCPQDHLTFTVEQSTAIGYPFLEPICFVTAWIAIAYADDGSGAVDPKENFVLCIGYEASLRIDGLHIDYGHVPAIGKKFCFRRFEQQTGYFSGGLYFRTEFSSVFEGDSF